MSQMARNKDETQFVEEPDNKPADDARAHARRDRKQAQEQAQEQLDATPKSGDGTPLTDAEQHEAERFAPVNESPDNPLETAVEAHTGAVDEAALGPLGSATQTGGTSYYAATDIAPRYATPFYPPTDYAHAAITSQNLTDNPSFTALGSGQSLVVGDPFPPENDFEDAIETDGRANTGLWEVKDYNRRLHVPLFAIDSSLRVTTSGKLPYPANPDIGGGASGVIQDTETPS
jgi:hypothetical protein